MLNFLKFLLLLPFCLQANPKSGSEGSEKSEETKVESADWEGQVEEGIRRLNIKNEEKNTLIENLQKALSEANANYEKENKNYEKAVEALGKATETKAKFAQKIKELAAQRDEYKSRVDHLERELDQKNKLFLLFASMSSKSNEELDALLEYSKKTLKAEEKE